MSVAVGGRGVLVTVGTGRVGVKVGSGVSVTVGGKGVSVAVGMGKVGV